MQDKIRRAKIHLVRAPEYENKENGEVFHEEINELEYSQTEE